MAEGMFGPYRLDGLLGRGGMGEVHRAFDTRKRDRLVALKLLPESLSADDEFRARFQREAEIAAMLREPHVIPIHDYGEIDGRLYLDMRLVDGTDLATVVCEGGPLAPDRAVGIVEQVAAALDAAHRDGLIHRDVKPSNILVAPGPPEFVYLVDFGIARGVRTTARGRITGTGATIGTLEYMAPERFLSEKIDHRVDIYALACVLFETLTGRPPFVGELPTLMRAHLDLPAPSLAEHRPGLPAELDEVIAHGMAKQPDDRYSTAGILAAAARTALTAAPAPAMPQARGEPARATPVLQRSAPASALPMRDTRAPEVAPSAPPGKERPLAPPTVDAPIDVTRASEPSPTAERRVATRRRRVWLSAAVIVILIVLAASALVVGLRPASIREHVLSGHTAPVYAVATAQLDGRPVVVSGSADKTLRVWDLATGAPVGRPLTGHTDAVYAVAAVELNGRPVIVSGSGDRTIRMWNLVTGAPIGRPLTGHTDVVQDLATARLGDLPVIISASKDLTIRIWDLAAGSTVGQPLTGHLGWVLAVASAEVDNRSVIISGGAGDGAVRVWDLATRTPIGQPPPDTRTGPFFSVLGVTAAKVANRTVIIAGSDDNTAHTFDLTTSGTIERSPLTGHTSSIPAVATAQLGGRPVLISGSTDRTLRVWDLANGAPIGRPLTGHTSRVHAVATTPLDGRPVIVSGGADGTIRTWDLATRTSS